jgi:adenylate cyclase
MIELVFLTGARAGEVVPVNKNLIGGRSPDCSLEVPDPNASRQHARFMWDGAELTVADNGSSNGTYVNDQRLTAAMKVNHGDVVRLGETRIRVQSRNRQDQQSSSIFSFKEAEADLSQSIVLSVSEIRNQTLSVEALTVRLNAIIQVSKALANITQLEKVFGGILERMFDVFPQADRGFLMLGTEAGKLEPKAMRQRGKAETENLSVSNTICRKALESKSAFLFNSQNAGDFDQGMSIVSLRIRSAMTIPLMVNEEILGLLQIDTPDSKRAFTLEDLQLAVAVCHQAAIALHNAQLLQRVDAEATMRNNLKRFLPGPLAEQVASGKLNMDLGGKNYPGTILFSDIIGFTSMSETLAADAVVALMNRYFDRMVPCIEQNGGSVDKFMGDAIMAVWGIPFDKDGQAATHAIESALAMQCGLAGLNSIQSKDGSPLLRMGIGINTGTVVAGNIGFSNRMEYTVLGDNVNTAQRLESNAGQTQILVSAATWEALAANGYGLAMPPLRVKNKAEPLKVYSVRGLKILNDEVMLHLPVMSSSAPAYLIRRLGDRTFILLHSPDCDICIAPLVTEVAEWPGIELGVPEIIALLPTQQADGHLLRSHIRLKDESLHGLLGTAALDCDRDWDAMQRSQTP